MIMCVWLTPPTVSEELFMEMLKDGTKAAQIKIELEQAVVDQLTRSKIVQLSSAGDTLYF